MVPPWFLHGSSMVRPWFVHGSSMVCPSIWGFSMEEPWSNRGHTMEKGFMKYDSCSGYVNG
ncbi:MAG: hypothetical protein N4A37_12515 [Prolixibacteraceae bacterium]|nr:hypothetical protein [Prolixibacteraceae bacterium]